jgi:molybdopterin biosynthesis enzyme
MAATPDTSQIIARLTPLTDVLAAIDLRVKPVAPRTLDVGQALGRTLAANALVPARPNVALALLDGWAMRADDTLGAGNYSPALLLNAPQRIEVGQPMPPDTDSVAPFDAVNVKVGNARAEALVTVNPGDGVLPAGGDCDPAIPLRRAGERLRMTDLAAFAAAGLARILVREPRVHILPVRGNAIVNAAARLLAGDIDRHGGVARLETGRDLGLALAAETADAIVIIGGTGRGRNDTSVQTLAREGELVAHGIALTPGETAALGFIGPRPVLLLPGRLDAALAVWLAIGRRLFARLAGGDDGEVMTTATLARKVASPVGLAEFVPVRQVGDTVEPLAAKYLPLSALARADGWMLVPAESEGYPEGAKVAVKAWP